MAESEELEPINGFTVRSYRPGDRPMIRKICADTGFLGQPIDPVFEDRELFADYLTSYYTDKEPESAVVCERDGQVMGYVLGSRLPKAKKAYEARLLPILAARGLWRYFTKPYSAASRRYVKWIMTQARKEVPFTPPNMPHIHINILGPAKSVPITRRMIDHYFNHLVRCGEKAVYGQIVGFEDRRGERLFMRWGFTLVDRREVTKYKDFHEGKVYLLTIVKDLTANPTMNGLNLTRGEKKPEAAG
jgi:hypothetical protein